MENSDNYLRSCGPLGGTLGVFKHLQKSLLRQGKLLWALDVLPRGPHLAGLIGPQHFTAALPASNDALLDLDFFISAKL
jgi:hypothetical protein